MDDRDEEARLRSQESDEERDIWRRERHMARDVREMEREMAAFEKDEARTRRTVKGELERRWAPAPGEHGDGPVEPDQLERAVQAALRRDPHIRRPELIAVWADGIGAVRLRGAVGTRAQRQAAVHDARHVPGVREVIDELRVHPSARSRRADDEIRVEALAKLSGDRLRWGHIRLAIAQGRVTLRGYVRHDADVAAAAELLRTLPGVVEVTDRVEVRDRERRAPFE